MSQPTPKLLGEVIVGAGDDAKTLRLYDDWTWETIPDDGGLLAELLAISVPAAMRSPSAGEPGHKALRMVAAGLGGKAKLPRVNGRKGRIY